MVRFGSSSYRNEPVLVLAIDAPAPQSALALAPTEQVRAFQGLGTRRRASFRALFSTVALACSFFNFAFSGRSALRRVAFDTAMPPNSLRPRH
jgi:hypothetical protein